MKKLHHKVNIVPLLAKSDILTKVEKKRLKQRVSAGALRQICACSVSSFFVTRVTFVYVCVCMYVGVCVCVCGMCAF